IGHRNRRMSLFRTPLSSLTRGDLERLITGRVSEDQGVEFKQDLPTNKSSDPWHQEQREMGEKAKIEIVAELIAMANTAGGTLLLGIEESREKPPRAAAIRALPKCHDLADRFRDVCRDLVEPRFPSLEIVGVDTEADGSGVVVFQVGMSASAPHRHSKTKE